MLQSTGAVLPDRGIQSGKFTVSLNFWCKHLAALRLRGAHRLVAKSVPDVVDEEMTAVRVSA